VVDVATVAELQSAVASLASDTTIRIAAGSYDLDQTLVVGGGVRDVTIRGATGDRDDVVLVGRGMSNPSFGNVPHGFLVQQVDGLLIADLTVRDVYYHPVQVQGEQDAQRVRLYNVRLLDGGEQLVKVSTAGPPGPYADDGIVACSLLEYTDRARSWYTNGVDVLAGARWQIRDNVFRNIRAPVGELAGPAVLLWRNCIDSVVERNLFVECDRAIALGLATPDGNARDGETTYDHQRGVARNNFVWRSAGSPTGDVGITANHSADYRIFHNTVVLNGTFPWTIEYRFAESDGLVWNNLTDGPIQQRDGASADLAGNVANAQPSWFVDEPSADLHLDASADQAIDRGWEPIGVWDDYDGGYRGVGSGLDVGADERCLVLPFPIAGVRVERTGDDLMLQWDFWDGDVLYNVWTVTDAADAELARQSGVPTANGVDGCSPPDPALGPACLDRGGALRSPELIFYQVRSYCGGFDEGP
jgi:hypothetical protein